MSGSASACLACGRRVASLCIRCARCRECHDASPEPAKLVPARAGKPRNVRTWEVPPERSVAPRVCDGCKTPRLYLVRLTAPPLAGVRLCLGCLARADDALLTQRPPAGARGG